MTQTAYFRLADARGALRGPRPGLTIMFAVWLALIFASLAQDLVSTDGPTRLWLLDVDYEGSAYTWFSELLLAGAALLMFLIGRERPSTNRLVNVQWLLLSALAFFLSMDEAVSLHEKLTEPLQAALNTTSGLYFAWIIPYGIVCIVGLMLAIPFLRSLPRRTAGAMALAAGTFLAGALGCEMVGGALMEDEYALAGVLPYRMASTLEEALEGLGVLIIIRALLDYRQGLLDHRS